jgi:hypothetical protein
MAADALMVYVVLQESDSQNMSKSSFHHLKVAVHGDQPYTDCETVVPPSRIHIPAVWPIHLEACTSLPCAYRRPEHGRNAYCAVSKYLKVVVGG